MKIALAAATLLLGAAVAQADPVTYEIDPNHTFPSFEADHFGGVSIWRGRFDHTSGTIVLDREKGTGTVAVTIDTTSIDFGMAKLDEHVKSAEMFDVEKYPTATYKGAIHFKDGAPSRVEGEFTLHGVTRPLTLTIHQFLCKTYPDKKEHCGADAEATLDRADYGISLGEKYGFKMAVKLLIQVEAARAG